MIWMPEESKIIKLAENRLKQSGIQNRNFQIDESFYYYKIIFSEDSSDSYTHSLNYLHHNCDGNGCDMNHQRYWFELVKETIIYFKI